MTIKPFRVEDQIEWYDSDGSHMRINTEGTVTKVGKSPTFTTETQTVGGTMTDAKVTALAIALG